MYEGSLMTLARCKMMIVTVEQEKLVRELVAGVPKFGNPGRKSFLIFFFLLYFSFSPFPCRERRILKGRESG
jgi:hypothetical protein